jgi:hypothetical protein
MLSKTSQQLIRLSAILHLLEVAFEIGSQLKEAAEEIITDAFIKHYYSVKSTLDKSVYVISSKIFSRAKNLLDYCNLTRLAFSGFEFNINNSFDDEIKIIIEEMKKTKAHKTISKQTIYQKLLLFNGEIINQVVFRQANCLKSIEIKQAFNVLARDGLGTLREKSVTKGLKKSLNFHKISMAEIRSI